MTQLAAISQDPWFSRVHFPDARRPRRVRSRSCNGCALSNGCSTSRAGSGMSFRPLGAVGFPKTSGADGLHIYIPLPPGTPYEAGLLFCQIVATIVAQKHPKIATVERSVTRARPARVHRLPAEHRSAKRWRSAYSARASTYAGVSTPLSWDEVEQGVRREDFTIETMPERLKKVGDLWRGLRTSKGIDLSRVTAFTTDKGRKGRTR